MKKEVEYYLEILKNIREILVGPDYNLSEKKRLFNEQLTEMINLEKYKAHSKLEDLQVQQEKIRCFSSLSN